MWGTMEGYLKANKGYDRGLFSYTDISKDVLKFTVFDYVETGSLVSAFVLIDVVISCPLFSEAY